MPLTIPIPEQPRFVGNKQITGSLTVGGQILAADGAAAAPGIAIASQPGLGFYSGGANVLVFRGTTPSPSLRLEGTDRSVTIAPQFLSGFSNVLNIGTASGAFAINSDVILGRAAAGVLVLRNLTTAQKFKVNTTYTDDSNEGAVCLDATGSAPGLYYERVGSAGSLDLYVFNRSNGGITFGTNGNNRWSMSNSSGNLSALGNWNIWNGTSALATTATAGFLGINSSAGPPTGVPAGIPTGQIPMQFDSTAKKLYAYIAGSWVASAAFS